MWVNYGEVKIGHLGLRVSPDLKYAFDLKKAKYSVAFFPIIFSKASKKQKYIADGNSLISEMGLRSIALTKSASTIVKHRIKVALHVATHLTACCSLDFLT